MKRKTYVTVTVISMFLLLVSPLIAYAFAAMSMTGVPAPEPVAMTPPAVDWSEIVGDMRNPDLGVYLDERIEALMREAKLKRYLMRSSA